MTNLFYYLISKSIYQIKYKVENDLWSVVYSTRLSNGGSQNGRSHLRPLYLPARPFNLLFIKYDSLVYSTGVFPIAWGFSSLRDRVPVGTRGRRSDLVPEPSFGFSSLQMYEYLYLTRDGGTVWDAPRPLRTTVLTVPGTRRYGVGGPYLPTALGRRSRTETRVVRG